MRLQLFNLGILLTTAARYAQRFPNDRCAYKILVAAVVTMAVASSCINAGYVYVSLINHFGNYLYS